jgi:hypothetical protein
MLDRREIPDRAASIFAFLAGLVIAVTTGAIFFANGIWVAARYPEFNFVFYVFVWMISDLVIGAVIRTFKKPK